ncbi:hypothetical protein RJ641_001156, partial [Dillenia turbinata]
MCDSQQHIWIIIRHSRTAKCEGVVLAEYLGISRIVRLLLADLDNDPLLEDILGQNAGAIHQNQEFSIRNEDFPALPGFKVMALLAPEVMVILLWIIIRKRSLHENPVSMVQPQPILNYHSSDDARLFSESFCRWEDLVVLSVQDGMKWCLNCGWIENSEVFGYCGGGLNLNSPSDLHKTFAFPWAEEPIKGDPEYTVPKMLLCASSLPLNVTYQRTKLNYEQPMN